MRHTSRQQVGRDIANSVPNTTVEETEALQEFGEKFAAFEEAGWSNEASRNLAQIAKILKEKNPEAKNLSELFKGVNHIDERHISELKEYLKETPSV